MFNIGIAFKNLFMIMVIGYFLLSRTFAYVGVNPIFIGELSIALFLLLKLPQFLGIFNGSFSRKDILSPLLILVLAFLGYGVLETIRGISINGDVRYALLNFAFNYYPLFIIVGLWIGREFPTALPRALNVFAVLNAVYGTAYIAGLSRITATLPGQPDVLLVGPPAASGVALLWLLTGGRTMRRRNLLVAANAFVLVGMQVRAEWLGFVVAAAVMAVVYGLHRVLLHHTRAILGTTLLLTSVLGTLWITDLSVPAPSMRGGTISVRGVMGRVIAIYDPVLAADYTEKAESVGGTVNWRRDWWAAIQDAVDDGHQLVGLGYGYPLSGLVNYIEAGAVRTPHNIYYYALGYSGYIGVALFFTLHLTLGWLLLRGYRRSGQPFGLLAWVQLTTMSLLGNHYETPAGAIPTYLLLGTYLGSTLLAGTPTDRRAPARTFAAQAGD